MEDVPSDLPPAACARIMAREIEASREFDEQKQSLRRPGEIAAALRKYILRVFAAFAEEALELGRQNIWTVQRIESESREFVRRTAVRAWYEKGFDHAGRALPRMTGDWGEVLPEYQREFKKSAQWEQFQCGLHAVAELQGSQNPRSGQDIVGPDAASGSNPVRRGALCAGIEAREPSPLKTAPASPVAGPETAPPARAEFRGKGHCPPLNLARINAWIKNEGFSNRELANDLHVSERVLSSIRNNGRYHGRKAIQKLAEQMGCDEFELYLS